MDIIGAVVEWVDAVDSTNEEMARRLDGDSQIMDGMVIVANDQWKGRGMGQNRWESEPGLNLTFSFLVSPDFLEAHQQFYLNMAVSLGVSHAVGSCLPGQKVEVKWPNDIYVKRNKLAGILLQNSISGNCIDHSIVGVGLNVNQTIFSPAITNPGSLRLFSGHDLDRKKVLQDLLKNLNAQYVRIMNGDLAGCASDYHDILYGLHQWLQYKHGDRELTARIIGIEETGQLILETKEKERLVCGVKEIEYLF